MIGLIRIIILGMLFFLARSLFLKFRENRKKRSARVRSEAVKKTEPKKTLRCDHCGIYIPVSEALQVGEKVYCCSEHREQCKKPEEREQ